MKKLLAVLMTLIMTVAMLTACSEGTSEASQIESEFTPVGSSLALMGSFTNTSDEAVSATVTVNWYDETNNLLGSSIAEFPYIEGTDTVFDVFNYDEIYDSYDCVVETAPVTEEATAFYNNLTVEGEMKDDGTVEFKVGGGDGEKFKADVVIVYTDSNDKPIDFKTQKVKGEGIASGTFKPTKAKDCMGYRINMIPKGLM